MKNFRSPSQTPFLSLTIIAICFFLLFPLQAIAISPLGNTTAPDESTPRQDCNDYYEVCERALWNPMIDINYEKIYPSDDPYLDDKNASSVYYRLIHSTCLLEGDRMISIQADDISSASVCGEGEELNLESRPNIYWRFITYPNGHEEEDLIVFYRCCKSN